MKERSLWNWINIICIWPFLMDLVFLIPFELIKLKKWVGKASIFLFKENIIKISTYCSIILANMVLNAV